MPQLIMNEGTKPAQLLDRDAALKRIGGDEELLREIAALFLAEYPSLIEDVRLAVRTGDADALEHAAHNLKGSVANFEASPAVSVAFRMESIGRSGRMDEAASALKELEAAFDALHPCLIDLSSE